MMNKLPKSNIEFEIRDDEPRRKEIREYNSIIFAGANLSISTKKEIDASDLLSKVSQKDEALVLMYVTKYDKKDGINQDDIDDMFNSDFVYLYDICEKKQTEFEKKKD